MRAHVERARRAGRDRHRSHVIEEDERTHHAPLRNRQDAPHFKAAADVAAALVYDEVDRRWSHRGKHARVEQMQELKACRRAGTNPVQC
jgi:hypothetical protein